MHKWASGSSVCISKDISVTIDALSENSSQESDFIIDKIAPRFSVNRSHHFSNFCAVVIRPSNDFQRVGENKKKRPEHPYFFSYDND